VTGLTDEDEQKLADCVVRLIQLGGDRSRPNAARLTGLAVDLVRAGLLEQAARVQQGAVDLLRPLAAGPDPAVRVELADALHNYTIRLLEIDRAQEAAQTADEAIAVYHEASGLAGADQATILREVTIFANALSHNRIFLHQQATRAQEEEVSLLRSTGGTDAASQVQLADALHTLTMRLIEVDRRVDAVAAAEEAITRYADAARLPGADHNKIISELRLFGNELAGNGLPDLADRARQAADRIM
jgi:tetratricopeptide (TPR) repeat protein